MFIPDPDFCPSRISDPKQQQKRGVKNNLFYRYLFCRQKYHKIDNYFILERAKKKILANFQLKKNYRTKKLSISSQKYSFGIRHSEKANSGSRINGSKTHRIPDTDPQHWKIPAFDPIGTVTKDVVMMSFN
jgi:hypothetical protein